MIRTYLIIFDKGFDGSKLYKLGAFPWFKLKKSQRCCLLGGKQKVVKNVQKLQVVFCNYFRALMISILMSILTCPTISLRVWRYWHWHWGFAWKDRICTWTRANPNVEEEPHRIGMGYKTQRWWRRPRPDWQCRNWSHSAWNAWRPPPWRPGCSQQWPLTRWSHNTWTRKG